MLSAHAHLSRFPSPFLLAFCSFVRSAAGNADDAGATSDIVVIAPSMSFVPQSDFFVGAR